MAKSSGGTRSSSASAPSSMSTNTSSGSIDKVIDSTPWQGSNGIYSIRTEFGRAGVSYMPLDGGYNVIVNGEMHEDAFSEDLKTAQKNAKDILKREAKNR